MTQSSIRDIFPNLVFNENNSFGNKAVAFNSGYIDPDISVDNFITINELQFKDKSQIKNVLFLMTQENKPVLTNLTNADILKIINNFRQQYPHLYEILNLGNIVIAGGFANSLLCQNVFGDIDFFIYGVHDNEMFINKLRQINDILLKHNIVSNGIDCFRRTRCAFTFMSNNTTYPQNIQVVLKFYNNKREIISSFDVSPCQICFDGNIFETTILGKASLEYQVQFLELFTIFNNTYIFPNSYRILKYMKKGFDGILFNANNNTIESIKEKKLKHIFLRSPVKILSPNKVLIKLNNLPKKATYDIDINNADDVSIHNTVKFISPAKSNNFVKVEKNLNDALDSRIDIDVRSLDLDFNNWYKSSRKILRLDEKISVMTNSSEKIFKFRKLVLEEYMKYIFNIITSREKELISYTAMPLVIYGVNEIIYTKTIEKSRYQKMLYYFRNNENQIEFFDLLEFHEIPEKIDHVPFLSSTSSFILSRNNIESAEYKSTQEIMEFINILKQKLEQMEQTEQTKQMEQKLEQMEQNK